MPSKNKIGRVAFNWAELVTGRRFSPHALGNSTTRELSRILFGGLDIQQRFEKIFDPELTDSSELKMGFFYRKAVTLPSSRIPKTESELLLFCRQLVDRGSDDGHLRRMLKSFPAPWTLDKHANVLWSLHGSRNDLFRHVVQGVHGEAIRCFKENPLDGWSVEEFKALLQRQALLWCAMDAQMAVSAAAVATSKPFGSFLEGLMREPKGGTIIRLMREGLVTLRKTVYHYQTLDEIKASRRSRSGHGAGQARDLGRQIMARLRNRKSNGRKRFTSAKFFRRRLDQSIVYIRARVEPLADQINYLETYNVGDSRRPKSTNRFRSFHQIWYSDLTAAAGTAVALMRFAMAEVAISSMVDAAFSGEGKTMVAVSPLSPPVHGLNKRSSLFKRVLDLLDSARRVQLRDSNNDSRTRGQHDWDEDRDPADLAGLTIVEAAYEFLLAVGQRHRHAYNRGQANDRRQQTYWHLDVILDVRLNMVRDPDVRFIG